jgi:hypothetical protein
MIFAESLNGFWKKELADRGDTVTYKLKKEDFYVVSGVNQFYHKVFFYPLIGSSSKSRTRTPSDKNTTPG